MKKILIWLFVILLLFVFLVSLGWVNEEGSLPGLFSVSDTRIVKFSKGNLCYQESSDTWYFASKQYYYLGEGNEKGFNYSYKDFFDKTVSKFTFKFIKDDKSDYNYRLIKEGEFIDNNFFGHKEEFPYSPGIWRSLSDDEWSYLLWGRKNAHLLFGFACLDNKINGLVLLPDSWSLPVGLTFNSGHSKCDSLGNFIASNNYEMDQWCKMEEAGAVFIPAGGTMIFEEVESVRKKGYVWTSSSCCNMYFHCCFSDIGTSCDEGKKHMIRLVMDY